MSTNTAPKYYPTLREAYLSDFSECDYIAEILEYENPTTPVYLNTNGRLYFVEDPATEMLRTDLGFFDLNQLHERWFDKFAGGDLFYKNDPRYRTIMQRIGYSVYGYWEITRWEANNPHYELYVDPNRDSDV